MKMVFPGPNFEQPDDHYSGMYPPHELRQVCPCSSAGQIVSSRASAVCMGTEKSTKEATRTLAERAQKRDGWFITISPFIQKSGLHCKP